MKYISLLFYYFFINSSINLLNCKIPNKEDNMDLIKRSQNMIDELGISITAFCRKNGISTSYFYYVKNGKMDFSSEVAERLNKYLSKYGF